jgi:uracil-DNA glycosylase
MKLKIIITLGKVAFDNCLKFYKKKYNLDKKFHFKHGKTYNLPGNVILMPSYHPSPRNVNTKLLSQKMMIDLFRKAKKLSTV